VDCGTVPVHGGLTAAAAKRLARAQARQRCGAWILAVAARGARGG
jgi:hypothetical protein